MGSKLGNMLEKKREILAKMLIVNRGEEAKDKNRSCMCLISQINELGARERHELCMS